MQWLSFSLDGQPSAISLSLVERIIHAAYIVSDQQKAADVIPNFRESTTEYSVIARPLKDCVWVASDPKSAEAL